MVIENVNTYRHRGRENKNKRSRNYDEFILKQPNKPLTFTGENGMDYLDVETYE